MYAGNRYGDRPPSPHHQHTLCSTAVTGSISATKCHLTPTVLDRQFTRTLLPFAYCCIRGYLGTGSVDFAGLFRGLAAIDYQGPITFESFSSAVVSPELSNTLCVWRNMWSDLDDLARQAYAFMQQQWTAAKITAAQAKYSTPGL